MKKVLTPRQTKALEEYHRQAGLVGFNAKNRRLLTLLRQHDDVHNQIIRDREHQHHHKENWELIQTRSYLTEEINKVRRELMLATFKRLKVKLPEGVSNARTEQKDED